MTDRQTGGRTDTAWRHRPRLCSTTRQKSDGPGCIHNNVSALFSKQQQSTMRSDSERRYSKRGEVVMCFSGTVSSGVQRQRHYSVIIRAVVMVTCVWRRSSTPLCCLVGQLHCRWRKLRYLENCRTFATSIIFMGARCSYSVYIERCLNFSPNTLSSSDVSQLTFSKHFHVMWL